MKYVLSLLILFSLAACERPQQEADVTPEAMPEKVAASLSNLADILDAQPEDVRARYRYRHPQETLEFFGIEPGMTVMEGLPGRGWYTKILLQYLGPDGSVVAVDYPMDIWPYFAFGTEEFIAKRANWPSEFQQTMTEWSGENGAQSRTMLFGSMPEDIVGTVDAVFFPRVLHNLANHDAKGNYLSKALNDAYNALKPGGVFGVVQHEARADMPDDWADGSRGYLKKAFVIEQAEKAGFEFIAESSINENEKDRPGADDIVWRLPPSLRDSRDDPERKAAMEAIGESNRMTLKFRKPG